MAMYHPSATLTAHNAQTALQAGMQAIAAGQTEIDLGQLTVVDSAAVATLLAWKRAAAERGGSLTFHHMPTNLHSLADLYGVSDLLES
jgi:phospholipid transport system transporter-binding protein